jgi:hypothetical protein
MPGCRRSEFVFINPNAKGTCGCGESFTVDPKAAKQNAAATAAAAATDGGGGDSSGGAVQQQQQG